MAARSTDWLGGMRVLSVFTSKMASVYAALVHWITALFNNMRTLKFKSRPTNAFFAAINQTSGGFSQLTTTAEHCFVVWTVHSDLITAHSAVVGGWEELPNIWLTVAKNAFVGWALNFRVCILLNGAVRRIGMTCQRKWICFRGFSSKHSTIPLSVICKFKSQPTNAFFAAVNQTVTGLY